MSLPSGEPAAVGIDVGGTHLRAALVDAAGRLIRRVCYTVMDRTPHGVLKHLDRACQDLAWDTELDQIPIGLGLAAQILTKTGQVAVAPNLGWKDLPFGQMLEDHFKQKVRMINDLNAITVGESLRGAGEGAADVVCIFIGTGVGMGAMVQGQLMEGSDGLATELGHIKIESSQEGRWCGCGERGCLEAYTSGRHLPELLASKVAEGIPSLLEAKLRQDCRESLTAADIDAAAVAHDQAACALWEDVSDRLGRAIGNVITLLNPRILVLGGGVWTAAPRLKQHILAYIERYAALPARRQLLIRDTQLQDNAGVIGAALWALQERHR